MQGIHKNDQRPISDGVERYDTSHSDYDYSDDDDDYDEISFTEARLRNIKSIVRTLRQIRLSKRSKGIWFISLVVILIVYHCLKTSFLGANSYNKTDVDTLTVEQDLQEEDTGDFISQTKISSEIDSPFQIGCREPHTNQKRANAALVILARNSEVKQVIKSMKSMERHFNQWFNYPWVFLNDEPFSKEFKKSVSKYTSSKIEFGTIPKKKWNFSDKIDKDELHEHIANQGDRRIMYGNSESYHKMCRFFSGYFYKHELVKKRDWYWRVEPDVEFFCDLTYDPFIEMEKHNKKYGFNVLIGELYYTIPGLFKETRSFIRKHGVLLGNAWSLFIKDYKYAVGKNAANYDGLKSKADILQAIEENITVKKFLSMKEKTDEQISKYDLLLLDLVVEKSRKKPELYEDRFDLEEYNMCHFWSNFEIARTDLFNSPAYEAYFEHLEKSGGFYKERWGDAPVHSLAVGMLLDLKDIHYFRDIGYQHSAMSHCPGNSKRYQVKYQPSEKYYLKDLKEDQAWLSPDGPRPNGIGCRCRCPKAKDIEDSPSSCVKSWADITSDKYIPPKPVDVDFWEDQIERRLNNFLATGGTLGQSNVAEQLLNFN